MKKYLLNSDVLNNENNIYIKTERDEFHLFGIPLNDGLLVAAKKAEEEIHNHAEVNRVVFIPMAVWLFIDQIDDPLNTNDVFKVRQIDVIKSHLNGYHIVLTLPDRMNHNFKACQ